MIMKAGGSWLSLVEGLQVQVAGFGKRSKASMSVRCGELKAILNHSSLASHSTASPFNLVPGRTGLDWTLLETWSWCRCRCRCQCSLMADGGWHVGCWRCSGIHP